MRRQKIFKRGRGSAVVERSRHDTTRHDTVTIRGHVVAEVGVGGEV
jgi:hypothetical protein